MKFRAHAIALFSLVQICLGQASFADGNGCTRINGTSYRGNCSIQADGWVYCAENGGSCSRQTDGWVYCGRDCGYSPSDGWIHCDGQVARPAKPAQPAAC